MIGDQDDIIARLKGALPARWFPTDSPNLDAWLSGPAFVLAGIYSLIQYAILQTRIKTATDGWLDLIARDFFARRFQRRAAEQDDSYRTRIIAEIFRTRATRPGLISALTDLTGQAPIIFEPARVTDTGAYGGPYFAYGGTSLPMTGITADSTTITTDSTIVTADADATPFAGFGGWGSLDYPDQLLVTAFRSLGDGISLVNGYGGYAGGYGVGSIEYTNVDDIEGPITDAEIYDTIARTVAAGVTAWTRILSGIAPIPVIPVPALPSSLDELGLPGGGELGIPGGVDTLGVPS